MLRTAVAIGGVCVLCACGGSAQPTEHLAASMAALQSAQTAGAANEPQAELHLKLAHEQLEQGRHMMDNGDNERADAMIIRAYNDAQLALAMAREAQMRRQYEQFAEAHPELKSVERDGALNDGQPGTAQPEQGVMDAPASSSPSTPSQSPGQSSTDSSAPVNRSAPPAGTVSPSIPTPSPTSNPGTPR